MAQASSLHTTTPQFSRVAVMRAAWAIFRETYHYPAIAFARLGRSCFGWALKEAWRRGREKARLVAMTVEEKADRAGLLRRDLFRTEYADAFTSCDNLRTARAHAELGRLVA